MVGEDGKFYIKEFDIQHFDCPFPFQDSFEIEINGKLIFSRSQLGVWPDTAEIVEITKWGNKGKSFLHMYLCR